MKNATTIPAFAPIATSHRQNALDRLAASADYRAAVSLSDRLTVVAACAATVESVLHLPATMTARTVSTVEAAAAAPYMGMATWDEVLDLLSRMAAFGTLRRIHAATGNKRINTLRGQMLAALDLSTNAAAAGMGEYTRLYDREGKCKGVAYDPDDVAVLTKYSHTDMGVAVDLYQTAYLVMLEAVAAGVPLTTVSTERNGQGQRKARNVYQNACVAVRLAVHDHTGLESNSRTVWLEDVHGEVVRVPRYWDVGAFITDGGLSAVYAADAATTSTMQEMAKALKFSGVQDRIFRLRMQGVSLHDVAARLGIKRQTVQVHAKRMQAKAIVVFGEEIVFQNGTWRLADTMEEIV